MRTGVTPFMLAPSIETRAPEGNEVTFSSPTSRLLSLSLSSSARELMPAFASTRKRAATIVDTLSGIRMVLLLVCISEMVKPTTTDRIRCTGDLKG